jgi:hypothetical protein
VRNCTLAFLETAPPLKCCTCAVTFQTSFAIPDLNKMTDRVPIGSVALANQHVALNDALYDTVRNKEKAKDDAANPLVVNGQARS